MLRLYLFFKVVSYCIEMYAYEMFKGIPSILRALVFSVDVVSRSVKALQLESHRKIMRAFELLIHPVSSPSFKIMSRSCFQLRMLCVMLDKT